MPHQNWEYLRRLRLPFTRQTNKSSCLAIFCLPQWWNNAQSVQRSARFCPYCRVAKPTTITVKIPASRDCGCKLPERWQRKRDDAFWTAITSQTRLSWDFKAGWVLIYNLPLVFVSSFHFLNSFLSLIPTPSCSLVPAHSTVLKKNKSAAPAAFSSQQIYHKRKIVKENHCTCKREYAFPHSYLQPALHSV